MKKKAMIRANATLALAIKQCLDYDAASDDNPSVRADDMRRQLKAAYDVLSQARHPEPDDEPDMSMINDICFRLGSLSETLNSAGPIHAKISGCLDDLELLRATGKYDCEPAEVLSPASGYLPEPIPTKAGDEYKFFSYDQANDPEHMHYALYWAADADDGDPESPHFKGLMALKRLVNRPEPHGVTLGKQVLDWIDNNNTEAPDSSIVPVFDFDALRSCVTHPEPSRATLPEDCCAVWEHLLENNQLFLDQRDDGACALRSWVCDELTPKVDLLFELAKVDAPYDWEFVPVALKYLDIQLDMPISTLVALIRADLKEFI